MLKHSDGSVMEIVLVAVAVVMNRMHAEYIVSETNFFPTTEVCKVSVHYCLCYFINVQKVNKCLFLCFFIKYYFRV